MILPPGSGLLGLLAVAVFNRRMLPFALIALFISGAIAAKAPSAYGYFTALFAPVVALYALRQEERVIERVVGFLLGVSIIWASNNSVVVDAFMALSYSIIAPFFQAVAGIFAGMGFAAGLASLLAWALVSPRLIRLAEEEPLVAIGYVVLGAVVLAGAISAVPDYLKLALAIALLHPFSRALRGNFEALGEVAPVLFMLSVLVDPGYLAQIGAVLAIIELAVGVLSKKHAAAAAMWATAVMLV